MNGGDMETGSDDKLTLRRVCVAFVPLVALIGMIVLGVTMFGRDVGDGPSQISLVFATALAAVLAIAVERVPWSSLEQGITTSISKAGVSIMILFLIGMLSGAWMIGGVMYAGGMLRTIAEVALACVRGVAGLVGATAFSSASR